MKKIIVLAIDALEYELVKKFNCRNLMQERFGKTDISEFSEPRTIVLWGSFLSEKNIEKEILKLGKEKMWSFKVKKEESFLKEFDKIKIIDLPAFSYDLKQHELERKLLKEFFSVENGEEIKERYNKAAFKHHEKVKMEFLSALEGDYELVIGYFSIIDVIGHLNFGNEVVMKNIYKDLNNIAKTAKNRGKLLIVSDHGMKAIGGYGDHNNYGFWSFSRELNRPKITYFGSIIKDLK